MIWSNRSNSVEAGGTALAACVATRTQRSSHDSDYATNLLSKNGSAQRGLESVVDQISLDGYGHYGY